MTATKKKPKVSGKNGVVSPYVGLGLGSFVHHGNDTMIHLEG